MGKGEVMNGSNAMRVWEGVQQAAMADARSALDKASSAWGKASVVVGSMMASGMASADDFDGQVIATKIGVYVAAGVVILTAFVIGRWTLKAFGVIK